MWAVAEKEAAKEVALPQPAVRVADVKLLVCIAFVNLYAPASQARNWHLTTSGGCQRVTEPSLSPLLYKFIQTLRPLVILTQK